MDSGTREVSSQEKRNPEALIRRGRDERSSNRSLERLRNRIEMAAREITQLRKQNAELAEKIAHMESDEHDYAALLESGDDPEALRGKINSFIEAIDEFLKEGDRPA